MELFVLQILWYIVMGFVIIGYTILDGFDLGVGSLHLFAKGDTNRRIFINSIGPVWDGNEVWLVVLVGGLFAGFPVVYANVLSGFYNLVTFFLFAVIFRAVAIEFRSKRESHLWRTTWDCIFSIMSIILAFTYGLILGNFVQGVPLDKEGIFSGTIEQILTPYSVLIGITSVALLSMHGCIYLLMKTEGEIHTRLRRWVKKCMLFFVICYILTTIATIFYMPHMTHKMESMPYLFIFPILTLLFIINIPIQIRKNNDGWAFISSALCIASLFILFGLGTFPVLVSSTIDPSYSLTIFNTSSSEKTLKILLIMVLIGMPMVLGYGFWIYRIFKGKVKIDHMSY